MTQENKVCQNCKKEFVVEPDDSEFYEKIKVPAPTFCPECRMLRRMMWRNERALYKREDDFGKSIVAVFSPDKPYKVYEQNHWRSDKWDAASYGKDYDFSEPFFVQLSRLLQRVPQPNLANIDLVASDYVNYASGLKNCYLVFGTDQSEDVAYAARTVNCKNSYDLFVANKDELCFQNVNCHESYKVSFSINSSNNLNSAFLNNCHNCESCFACCNLRNKKYHVFNKPYTPEEYQKEIAKFDLGSHNVVEDLKGKFREFSLNFPRRFVMSLHTKNSSGDNLHKANNCHNCFDVEGEAENVKFLVYGVPGVKDSYDIYGVGFKAELCYEVLACGASTQRARFGLINWSSDDLQYCVHCYSSSHLFGCVGLKNKQYCILNKQYTKEQYEALLPRIIQHMSDMPYQDRKGRTYTYGEF
ncbi:MAG: hypothetical protein PHU56_04260, partial [Candidatus Pacebacteria bacterium]|nr:hypothetical protein [Candidatus Paceibacterota bacterium]